MMDSGAKKAMQTRYREREVVGGVYAIRNTLSNKLLVGAAVDLQGMKNRFAFSQKTGSCVDLKLQGDWDAQGGGQFVFDVLEELVKGESQTAEEFKSDVGILKGLWIEQLSGSDFY